MDRLMRILRNLHPDVDYESSHHLIDERILDSFDIVTLVTEISHAYDVSVPAEEIVPENFNSAEALYAMIVRLVDEE